MKLTQKEKEMVEAMRMGSQSQDSRNGNEYMAVEGNMKSSLHNLLSNASRSNNPDVKARANELLSELNSQGGLDNISLSDAQYQGLISEAHQAVQMDSNLSDDYSVLVDTANIYNSGKTDEEYTKELKQSFKEGQSDLGREETKIVINEQTGTKFVQGPDGKLSPYVDAEEAYEQASATSDEAFVSSGGEQQSFFDGLEDR